MILAGFSCPSCESSVLDSLNYCFHCKAPYSGVLLEAAKAHHEAKLRMIAANTVGSEEKRLNDVYALASVSEGIATISRASGHLPHQIIPNLFQKHEG